MTPEVRIIPVILLHKNQAYKTTGFSNPAYVGDPINLVKIFNEKMVDELLVIDRDATSEKRPPNFELLRNLARECQMPLTYAGGVSSREIAEKVISLGVEKVGVGSPAVERTQLLREISVSLGSQSLTTIINLQKKPGTFNGYTIWHNYLDTSKINPLDYIELAQNLGSGEILLHAIDLDGYGTGFDLNLLSIFGRSIKCVVTILGGAGNFKHFKDAIEIFDENIGLAAASFFTFQGRFKAVLPSYLSQVEKQSLNDLV